MICSLCSCYVLELLGSIKKPSDKKLVEQRIDEFVTSYNDGDVDEMIESFTAKTRNEFKAALKLFGVFASVDTYELFSSLFTLGVGMSEGDYIEVEIVEIDIEDDEAIVETKLAIPGAKQKAETTYFILEKEDDDWFISDITEDKP